MVLCGVLPMKAGYDMSQEIFDDETLMAFADGELDAVTSNAVEKALNDDVDLQARVAVFLETGHLAKTAVRAALDGQVPQKLKNDVQGLIEASRAQMDMPDDGGADDTIVPFRNKHPNKKIEASARGTASNWAMLLAACIALTIGAIGGYGFSRITPTQEAGLEIAILNHDGIGAALEQVQSGAESQLSGAEGRFRAIASFKDDAGAFCREFEVDQTDGSTLVAVACKGTKDWNVQFAVVAKSSETGYAPASSLEALDAYLSSIGAGEPMSTESEAHELQRAKP